MRGLDPHPVGEVDGLQSDALLDLGPEPKENNSDLRVVRHKITAEFQFEVVILARDQTILIAFIKLAPIRSVYLMTESN